ncbi:hypothetical protein KFK09_018633 [Dendrobium nobile]|uniref:Uncharacterized protein n=1 Tax=Dendrobium nobile TaxID=94219 RepID=A0A8T3AWD8_DENNO|nr:hypothetical protein KFK09_018633 [Dendrobium nobile]
MVPAKRKIESMEKNTQEVPQEVHSAYNNWLIEFEKAAFQFSIHLGADALLIKLRNEGFSPAKTSDDLTAVRYCGLKPALLPDPNQAHRRVSIQEQFVQFHKVLAKVRARIRFESQSKKNAENSSDQSGNLTSSAPTVVGDSIANQCG